MQKLIFTAVAATVLASAAIAAGTHDAPPTVTRLQGESMSSADMGTMGRGASSRISIDMDVKPAPNQPGRFVVTSTILDLESGAIVGKPRLVIGSDKPARIETGIDGKWMLQISVGANGADRKASYEATFSRDGIVMSRQRLAVDLNS